MSAARDATAAVEGDELVIRIRLPTPPAATLDKLLRLDKEACSKAGIELGGLRAKVAAGELAIVKIGRGTFVRWSDLLALAKPVHDPKPPAPPASGAYEVALQLASTKRRRRAGAA